MSYSLKNTILKSGVVFNLLHMVKSSKFSPEFDWQSDVLDDSEFLESYLKTKYVANWICKFLVHKEFTFTKSGTNYTPEDVFEALKVPSFTRSSAPKATSKMSVSVNDQDRRIRILEDTVEELSEAMQAQAKLIEKLMKQLTV